MSYLGKVRPTVALTSSDIEDNAVTTSKLIDDAVTTAKIDDGTIATADIADDAVTADKLANAINTSIAANTSKVTNATHTGDVTGATALTIATDAVDIAMLSATGTASSSTFLRGDNAWAAAGGDNTPAFQAYLSADQAIAHGTDTKALCDTEDFDTDSAYDNTTDYRFTVPVGEAGKYFCYSRQVLEAPAQTILNQCYARLYVNGSNVFWCFASSRANPTETMYFQNGGVIDLAEGDYLELFAFMTTTTSAAGLMKNYGKGTLFGAYKMIGL